MSRPQQITVLGATGSIGLSTLDVIARHPERYQVFALSGFTRLSELFALCVRHVPQFAVVPEAAAARSLQDDLRAAGLPTRVLVGEEGLCQSWVQQGCVRPWRPLKQARRFFWPIKRRW